MAGAAAPMLVAERPVKYKVFGILGSEFVAKLVACLTWLKIPYELLAVGAPLAERRKCLPKPYLVPVLQTPAGDVLVDSHDILVWLNENEPLAARRLYPAGLEEDVASVELASEVIYPHSQYIATCVASNFHRMGIYERAMEVVTGLTRYALICLPSKLHQVMAANAKASIEKATPPGTFAFPPPEAVDHVEALRVALAPFEARLLRHDFLCAEAPTAADFSAWAFLCKLCGPSSWGTACGGFVGPLYPSAEALFGEELPRLTAWHARVSRLAPPAADFSLPLKEIYASGAATPFRGPPLGAPTNAFDPEKHGKRVAPLLDVS